MGTADHLTLLRLFVLPSDVVALSSESGGTLVSAPADGSTKVFSNPSGRSASSDTELDVSCSMSIDARQVDLLSNVLYTE